MRNQLVTLVVGWVLIAIPAKAVPYFSVDAASPTSTLVGVGDILATGPIFGPPPIATSAASLGLAPGDDIDAMTSGGAAGGMIHFSVDAGSVGVSISPAVGLDVFSETAVGQQSADIYVAPGLPSGYPVHALIPLYNQDTLGLFPFVPPGTPSGFASDNLNALDLVSPVPALFSLPTGHPYLGTSVGCGSDVFGSGLSLVISHTALGLLCADDIDAMHIEVLTGTGDLAFSLAPGSPSLAIGSTIAACAVAGCSAADIFVAFAAAGPPVLAIPASALGLLPTDNVDALAAQGCPGPLVGDADADGIDDSCDNCLGVLNPFQWDANGDGYGAACDADWSNTGVVGAVDFSMLLGAFGSTVGGPLWMPQIDADLNGVTGGAEFSLLLSSFGLAPGPSGLPCAGTTVPCTH